MTDSKPEWPWRLVNGQWMGWDEVDPGEEMSINRRLERDLIEDFRKSPSHKTPKGI